MLISLIVSIKNMYFVLVIITLYWLFLGIAQCATELTIIGYYRNWKEIKMPKWTIKLYGKKREGYDLLSKKNSSNIFAIIFAILNYLITISFFVSFMICFFVIKLDSFQCLLVFTIISLLLFPPQFIFTKIWLRVERKNNRLPDDNKKRD